MPLLTSPQDAQTPSGAWFVGLWIPTPLRDPQDQLCVSSGIFAELSALHHTLLLGGTGEETQLTGGEVLSVYWGKEDISFTLNPTTAGI